MILIICIMLDTLKTANLLISKKKKTSIFVIMAYENINCLYAYNWHYNSPLNQPSGLKFNFNFFSF